MIPDPLTKPGAKALRNRVHSAYRPAGEVLLRNESGHPNLGLLITALVDALGVGTDRIGTDWDARRAECAELRKEEQQLLLETLALAIALTGRARGAQPPAAVRRGCRVRSPAARRCRGPDRRGGHRPHPDAGWRRTGTGQILNPRS
jgi:hypothetical protein